MEVYKTRRGKGPGILKLQVTSALDGGEWSASRPGRSLPTGKDPQYKLDSKLGGP
jgi:hypothetical protein